MGGNLSDKYYNFDFTTYYLLNMIFWNLKNFDNFSSRNQHALIEEDLCNFDILSKLVFNHPPMTTDKIYCRAYKFGCITISIIIFYTGFI